MPVDFFKRMVIFKEMPVGLTTVTCFFFPGCRVIKKFLRELGVKFDSCIDDLIYWTSTLGGNLSISIGPRRSSGVRLQFSIKKPFHFPVQRLSFRGVDLDLRT